MQYQIPNQPANNYSFPQQPNPAQKRQAGLKHPGFMPWSPLVFWFLAALIIFNLTLIGTIVWSVINSSGNGDLGGWMLVLSPIFGGMAAMSLATLSSIVPVIMCICNLIALRKIFPPVSGSKKTFIVIMNILWGILGLIVLVSTSSFAISTAKDLFGWIF